VLELETDNGAALVHVRIRSPVFDHAGDWTCPFEITGLARREVRYAHGVDGVQALELALQLIGTILYTSKEWEAGRLTWLGGRNLMLPVPNNLRDLVPD